MFLFIYQPSGVQIRIPDLTGYSTGKGLSIMIASSLLFRIDSEHQLIFAKQKIQLSPEAKSHQ